MRGGGGGGGREGAGEVMFLASFGNVSSSIELPLTDSLCLTNNTVMVSSAGSRAAGRIQM